jgi:hypothetical protein
MDSKIQKQFKGHPLNWLQMVLKDTHLKPAAGVKDLKDLKDTQLTIQKSNLKDTHVKPAAGQ